MDLGSSNFLSSTRETISLVHRTNTRRAPRNIIYGNSISSAADPLFCSPRGLFKHGESASRFSRPSPLKPLLPRNKASRVASSRCKISDVSNYERISPIPILFHLLEFSAPKFPKIRASIGSSPGNRAWYTHTRARVFEEFSNSKI